MTLHSILGGSRVKKRTSSSAAKQNSTPSPSWTAALTRTKPGSSSTNTKFNITSHGTNIYNNSNTANHHKLQDLGSANPLPPLLQPSSSSQSPSPPVPLRTPLQIHHFILHTMFDPLLPTPNDTAPLPIIPGLPTALPAPTTTGLGANRIATALHARAALPPLVSIAHLHALLLATGLARSPAAAEREIAGMVRAGKGRRVVVPTLRAVRGGGELFVLVEGLEGLVGGCGALGGKEGRDGRIGERFVRWLRANPGRTGMTEGDVRECGLRRKEVDVLVRAGFLTAVNAAGGAGGGGKGGSGLSARPDQRYGMISLETVSRAAAGSVAAAGGDGVIHAAGGTGARSMVGQLPGTGTGTGSAPGGFSIAVPGCGVYLKLISAALEHIADLLRRTQYRELPESDLREKWDGGIAGESEVALAKKARGEFTGVMPGRTKKWKVFHGLAFDWVLREAVGAGVVEVFETGSVGRGVRLV
ncbi:serine-threonine protein kinase 19-domain-containing protein [Chaetomium sp. MPI-SDFR-AT-0129]|nr:serine-threonine protein kinase 19-domain-containing protein [Chaetomium sp. MPI-SDFR-AT-0129]